MSAVLHGLDIWNVPLRRVHSTLGRASGGKITERRHVHAAQLPAEDVEVVDGRSESVGESRSRVLIHRLRLPAPDLQRVITDEKGSIGRVDFLFEYENAVGEFDGLGKYTDHLRPGQTTEQALLEEKFREDRLRGAGYRVARWGWRELSEPAEVARRLRRAFD